MKSSEFAYWLQSHFELGDGKPFTGSQITIIKNHLKLVRETAKKRKKGIEPFIPWIDTAIDVAVETKMDTAVLTELIQKKIAGVFIHVIDPKYGKHKDELLAVHAGGKPSGFTPVPRASGGFGSDFNRTYGC